MPERSIPDDWTRATIAHLARKYFPGRSKPLGAIVYRLAERNETRWRSTSEGVFRPTPSMYALALRWQLDRFGLSCLVCHGKVQVPRTPAPSHSAGPTLSLGFRIRPADGGLNVPQNLVLSHVECLPSRSASA